MYAFCGSMPHYSHMAWWPQAWLYYIAKPGLYMTAQSPGATCMPTGGGPASLPEYNNNGIGPMRRWQVLIPHAAVAADSHALCVFLIGGGGGGGVATEGVLIH